MSFLGKMSTHRSYVGAIERRANKRESTRHEPPLRFDSFGIDFVPAFRSLEWPKVAMEWITRDRCWPSVETVNNVVREGFHLVAKSSRNGGHPDRDFRISFSLAEYILSQEMNDIHRECYLCLKKYHTAFLSTEPRGLVTFHLENLFLRTIEETSVEMWTEQSRAPWEPFRRAQEKVFAPLLRHIIQFILL